MGLFWSLQPCSGPGKRYLKRDLTKPLIVHIAVHSGHLDHRVDVPDEECNPIASTFVERWYMGDNVEIIPVRVGRIQGTLLKPKGPGPFPAAIELFAAVPGNVAKQSSAFLASKGFASLSLGYFGGDGQPGVYDEALEMEYFEEALDWLSNQAYVQGGGVAAIGTSKGGEMALAMAVHFPEKIRAVAAVCSYGGFAMWATTYKGETFPCAHGTSQKGTDARYSNLTISGNLPKDANGHTIGMDFYDSIENTKYQKFENIECPTLLIHGGDDALVNPRFALKIAEKIRSNGKNDKVEVVIYPHAGHLIELPNSPACTAMKLPGEWGIIAMGGIPMHHNEAQVGTWKKIVQLLEDMKDR